MSETVDTMVFKLVVPTGLVLEDIVTKLRRAHPGEVHIPDEVAQHILTETVAPGPLEAVCLRFHTLSDAELRRQHLKERGLEPASPAEMILLINETLWTPTPLVALGNTLVKGDDVYYVSYSSARAPKRPAGYESRRIVGFDLETGPPLEVSHLGPRCWIMGIRKNSTNKN